MRRFFACLAAFLIPVIASAQRSPNVIIIMTDDQGYNDVGCYGSPDIKTPRLDKLASEGVRFTDFYSSAPVCSPSRAGLLTGCYPQRVSIGRIPAERTNHPFEHVFYSKSKYGLNTNEVTIAQVIKTRGYATGCVGKWHLGDATEFLPTHRGFDEYFGMPYSNDSKPDCIIRGDKVIEQHTNQDTLVERYTDEATKFIRAHKDEPFFLYFAHNAPHTPLHISKKFQGKSERGLYGDVVQAIDWSVGQVLDTLAELKLDENTLVIFTSDNGPWYIRGEDGGMATPLRSGKGTTYDGGMRVPCIMRWPGHIPPGSVCRDVACNIDFAPTVAAIAGATMPSDRIIDGKDIRPLMESQANAKTPHDPFLYYADGRLMAVRSGKWKLRFPSVLQDELHYGKLEQPDAPLPQALYNLSNDPGEQKNVAADHADIVARLTKLADAARDDLGDQNKNIKGKNVRPLGVSDNPPKP
ncbi:MAG TPA: sulfatase [Tepidisphaeraceae bacterium]|jgi:arylsulfatase A-like enzyme|nr:sulfatase [Tepidisphaeraceae bacterium]